MKEIVAVSLLLFTQTQDPCHLSPHTQGHTPLHSDAREEVYIHLNHAWSLPSSPFTSSTFPAVVSSVVVAGQVDAMGEFPPIVPPPPPAAGRPAAWCRLPAVPLQFVFALSSSCLDSFLLCSDTQQCLLGDRPCEAERKEACPPQYDQKLGGLSGKSNRHSPHVFRLRSFLTTHPSSTCPTRRPAE